MCMTIQRDIFHTLFLIYLVTQPGVLKLSELTLDSLGDAVVDVFLGCRPVIEIGSAKAMFLLEQLQISSLFSSNQPVCLTGAVIVRRRYCFTA